MGLETIGTALGLIGAGSSAIGGIKDSFGGRGKNQISPLFEGLQKNYLQHLPNLGTASMGTMAEMARTGMPTDVGPMFESLMKQRERSVEQGRGNILSQFGAAGLRYSTPLMNSLVDFENQVQADYGNILANYVFQALEAARGRQMQASAMGTQAFGTPALTMFGQPQKESGMSGLGGTLFMLGSLLRDVKWKTPTSPAIG